MDRAGRKASLLSSEEMTLVFDLVDRGGSSEEARRLLGARGRDRSTANRLYNVVRELAARDLDALDTPTALELAEAARYSTTVSFVQGVYLRWRAWKSRANACGDPTHQEFLRDRLGWLMLELKPLVRSFPGVFRLSYWPEDPANCLTRLEVDGIKRIGWELKVEHQPGWPLVQQHLESGMPEVAKALERVKEGYAAYCQWLLTLDNFYRERAREEQVRTGGVLKLNESNFYRSILAEVDQSVAGEAVGEYTCGKGSGSSSIGFGGTVLISDAEDKTISERWVELHRQWRREVRSEHLDGLLKLRQDTQQDAREVAESVEKLEQGGPVPGRCDRFS